MKKFLILFLVIVVESASQPPKIPNCGATCYISAATQALYAVSPLTEYLKENKNLYRENSFGQAYQNFVKASKPLQVIDRPILNNYISKAQAIMPTKGMGDAYEFLVNALDDLEKNITHKEDKTKTLLTNLFHFTEQIGTEYTIEEIPTFVPERFEVHSHLLLNIEPGTKTLKQCMENYIHQIFQTTSSSGTVQITFSKPQFLIIALKRYSINPKGAATKINDALEIPFEFNFPLHSPQKSKYRLIAAVIHSGATLKSGHYTAYIKHNNEWYLCDDHNVTKTTSDVVSNNIKTGYLYIYEKKPEKLTLIDLLQQLQEKLYTLLESLFKLYI